MSRALRMAIAITAVALPCLVGAVFGAYGVPEWPAVLTLVPLAAAGGLVILYVTDHLP